MDIVKKYVEEYGMIRHQFDTFHDFVFSGIQTVINDEPDIYTTTNHVVFKNVRFIKPFITINNKNKIPLTPAMARERSLTYDFTVKVDLECENTEKNKEVHSVVLCNIPAMVGSAVCTLYGKSEQEKVSLGEIIGDYGGYFVINGKERIITGQTRKTYNRMICFKNLDNEFICEMRSSSEETAKSSLIQVKLNSRKTNVDITIDNVNYSIGGIFKKLNALNLLENLIGTDHIYLDELIYLIKENVNDYNIDITQLFPHLGQSNNETKAILLGKMVRKLGLCESGILKEEDKSNLAYKRVDMVGVLCKDLFKMLWKQFIKSLTKEIEKRKIGSILPIVNIKKKNISINFYYCFSTGTWGIKKNSYKKTGVSEFAQNKVSVLTNLALLRKFNIPVGKKDKNIKIRQMHPSSIFFICPFETPEGASVGTRLTLAGISSVSSGMSMISVKEVLVARNLFDEILVDDIKDEHYIILLNGTPVGMTTDTKTLLKSFDELRVLSIIRQDVSCCINSCLKLVEIWCDSSRFIRPLIKREKFHCITPSMTIKDMENKGIIVHMDPAELENSYVSMEYDKTADYVEIHPCLISGVVASQIVFSNHTQSPRVCYMSNMIKQAMGIIPTLENRTDSTVYSLDYVQKPLNTTKMAEIIGTNEYPNGINAIVAVACYTGFNQEDSIIVNKSSIERGLFTASVKRTVCTDAKTFSSFEEVICVPPEENRLHRNYSKLDENGIVKKGTRVFKGDVLIGKILRTKNGDVTKIEDKSVTVKTNEEGIVDSVHVTSSMVKITITQLKIPEIGDKFCSGMAQKGTCGMILPTEDMPFTSDGMTPDIIINPHCLPSRMTINQIMSCICAKANALSGNPEYKDGSPFSGTTVLDKASQELENRGFHFDGTEEMYNGMTGHKMNARIFIGPVYYHRLTHLVSNKIFSSTNTNIKNKLTRQPLNGRSNDGGLRIGEMEKDCLLRHGIIKFSNERLMDLSDKYILKMCNKCNGYYNVTKIDNNNYICNKCKNVDISTVSIPYAAKLLVQELESMALNVTMTT